MMSGNPTYPKSDCGNNQWLMLMSDDYYNPLCVRGVLRQSEIDAAYKKALEDYQRAHRFDPTEMGGFPVDPRPLNLIDEVIGALTKGWNLKP